MFLVYRAHETRRWRKHLIDKDENGLLRRQVDAFADDIDKLADGEICGNQVLLLVDRCNVALVNLFADYLWQS